MDTRNAANILALANFGSSPVTLGEVFKFFCQFEIGRTSLGFNGVRLDRRDAPWLCFSMDDVERARTLWNPPPSSDEFQQGMIDESLSADELEAKLEGMFVDIHIEPWSCNICKKMQNLSNEARLFLENIAQQLSIDGINKGDFENKLMPIMENTLKQLHVGYPCFRIDVEAQPPRIVLNPYAVFSTIDDEITAKFYLAPFLAGTSSLWMRTRVCDECQKLFFYKQKRAHYCSQKCRMTVANRNRR